MQHVPRGVLRRRMGPVSTPRCGGTAKSTGKPCGNPAGFKTDHPGVGNCRFHGGLSPVKHGRYSLIKRDSLRAIADAMADDPNELDIMPEVRQARALYIDYINRYDEFSTALLAWYESWRAIARPVNGQLRAGMEYIIDEFEAGLDEPTEEQQRAINDARTYIVACKVAPEGRPPQVLDISDAHRLLDLVTKMVERVERIRAANAISRPDLMRVLQEMGRVVTHHQKALMGEAPPEMQDRVAAAAQRIEDDWLKIRV